MKLDQASLASFEAQSRTNAAAKDLLGVGGGFSAMDPSNFSLSRAFDREAPRWEQAMNLDDMIRNTQTSINSSQDALPRTQSYINKRENEVRDSEYQQSQLKGIQQSIPILQKDLQETTDRCTNAIQELLPMKEACIELQRQAGAIEETAATTVAGRPVGKREWTEDILAICSVGIFTPRLADEVQIITEELEREWGLAKPLPAGLSKAISSLKLRAVALLEKDARIEVSA
ncbi:hypothetical protein TWF281_008493 [Arthrobotrys megalospora]